MFSFKQWLEDAGEVHPSTNDEQYANRGVGSKVVNNDKKNPSPAKKSPESLFLGKNQTKEK